MSNISSRINRELWLRNLLGLFCFCTIALPLFPQAPPSQDTFVSASKPTTNYGGNSSLVVQAGGGGVGGYGMRGAEVLGPCPLD